MPSKLPFAGIGAACLLIAAGCATSANSRLPPATKTITLALAPDERAQIETLNVGSALKVVLPPPERPGDTWVIITASRRYLEQIAPLAQVRGSAGATVTFQAIRPGRTMLGFAAVKAGAAETDTTDTYEITVGIKGE